MGVYYAPLVTYRVAGIPTQIIKGVMQSSGNINIVCHQLLPRGVSHNIIDGVWHYTVHRNEYTRRLGRLADRGVGVEFGLYFYEEIGVMVM